MANLINDYYTSKEACVALYRDGLGEYLSEARELALAWCTEVRNKCVQDAKCYYLTNKPKLAKENLNRFHVMQKMLNTLRSQTNWEFIKWFNNETLTRLSTAQGAIVEMSKENKNYASMVNGLSENISALHGDNLCPSLHKFFLSDGDLSVVLKRSDLAKRSVQNYLARQIIKNNGNLTVTISEIVDGAENQPHTGILLPNPQDAVEK